jgi:hypothetical protein
MRRIHGFLIYGAVLAAWSSASAAPALSLEELFTRAGPRVLRLEVTRAPEPGVDAARVVKVANGSAVLVDLDPPKAPRFLTFATAYHVLTRATSFVAYAPGRPEPVASSAAPGAGAECFVNRSRELAFVRIAVDPASAARLEAVDIDNDAQLPASDGRLVVGPAGLLAAVRSSGLEAIAGSCGVPPSDQHYGAFVSDANRWVGEVIHHGGTVLEIDASLPRRG